MSVLIRSLEMPDTCTNCPLSHYYPSIERVWCNAEPKILAENYELGTVIKKPEWCPLEEAEDED